MSFAFFSRQISARTRGASALIRNAWSRRVSQRSTLVNAAALIRISKSVSRSLSRISSKFERSSCVWLKLVTSNLSRYSRMSAAPSRPADPTTAILDRVFNSRRAPLRINTVPCARATVATTTDCRRTIEWFRRVLP